MKKFTLDDGGDSAAGEPLALSSGDTSRTSPPARGAKTVRIVSPLMLGGLLGLLAGCGSTPDSHLVSAPPPPPPTASPGVPVATPMVVVPAQSAPVATLPAGSAVIVTQAPPSPPPEAVPPRPSADSVWVPGYWTWRNERYEWMAGHWEIPPHSGVTWIPPRWESERGSYRFYEGYWK